MYVNDVIVVLVVEILLNFTYVLVIVFIDSFPICIHISFDFCFPDMSLGDDSCNYFLFNKIDFEILVVVFHSSTPGTGEMKKSGKLFCAMRNRRGCKQSSVFYPAIQ